MPAGTGRMPTSYCLERKSGALGVPTQRSTCGVPLLTQFNRRHSESLPSECGERVTQSLNVSDGLCPSSRRKSAWLKAERRAGYPWQSNPAFHAVRRGCLWTAAFIKLPSEIARLCLCCVLPVLLFELTNHRSARACAIKAASVAELCRMVDKLKLLPENSKRS